MWVTVWGVPMPPYFTHYNPLTDTPKHTVRGPLPE